MSEVETPDTLRDDLCTAWHRYIDMLVPLRPTLYTYCRRLAGNAFHVFAVLYYVIPPQP